VVIADLAALVALCIAGGTSIFTRSEVAKMQGSADHE
jgi:hypothetical protein